MLYFVSFVIPISISSVRKLEMKRNWQRALELWEMKIALYLFRRNPILEIQIVWKLTRGQNLPIWFRDGL